MVRSCSSKITEGSRKPLSGPIRQCAGSASLPAPLLCNGSDNHRGAVLVSQIILENDHGTDAALLRANALSQIRQIHISPGSKLCFS